MRLKIISDLPPSLKYLSCFCGVKSNRLDCYFLNGILYFQCSVCNETYILENRKVNKQVNKYVNKLSKKKKVLKHDRKRMERTTKPRRI